MLKKMVQLEGVSELSKSAQKDIQGKGNGLIACYCPDGTVVVTHDDSCAAVIDHYCLLDS
jgi:hypothetical protein